MGRKPMPMRQWVAILAVIAAFAGTACWPFDDSSIDDMTVRRLAGDVKIIRGSEIIAVTGSDEALEPRDIVVTTEKALALVALEGERDFQMQRNSRLRVISPEAIESQKGSVLALVQESTRVTFDDAEAQMTSATFRLDRGFGSARAASYEGNVQVSAPGQPSLKLGTLYEIDVAAGDLPEEASPYELDERDAWDKEYLRKVIDLTRELELLASGFSRQVGRSRPGASYFQGLAPNANVSFISRYLNRRAADLLVGFTIAENDDDRSLKASFRRAFRLRDAGARWGVAATIMEVEPNPVIAQLEELILGTQVLASDGGGGSPDFTFASAEGSSAGSDSGDLPSTVEGGFGGPSDPDDPDDPDPKPTSDCENVVECEVEELEDELDPSPEPEPTPTDLDGSVLDGI